MFLSIWGPTPQLLTSARSDLAGPKKAKVCFYVASNKFPALGSNMATLLVRSKKHIFPPAGGDRPVRLYLALCRLISLSPPTAPTAVSRFGIAVNTGPCSWPPPPPSPPPARYLVGLSRVHQLFNQSPSGSPASSFLSVYIYLFHNFLTRKSRE